MIDETNTNKINSLDVSDAWKRKFELIEKAGEFNGFSYENFKSLSFGERIKMGFNIFALLFGPFYYFYKQMWKKGAVILGIGLVFIVTLLAIEMATDTSFPSSIYKLPIIEAICGSLANYDFYRFKVHQETIWKSFSFFNNPVAAFGFPIVSLALLFALAFHTSVPKCSDDETLSLVKEIIIKQIGGEGASEKEIKESMVVDLARANSEEKSIKKYTCEAKVIAGGLYQLPIKYETQLNDNNQHIVHVDGIRHADLQGLKTGFSQALQKSRAKGLPAQETASPSPNIDTEKLDDEKADGYVEPQEPATETENIEPVTTAVQENTDQSQVKPPAPFNVKTARQINDSFDTDEFQAESALGGAGSVAIFAKYLDRAFDSEGYSLDETLYLYLTQLDKNNSNLILLGIGEKLGFNTIIGALLLKDQKIQDEIQSNAKLNKTMEHFRSKELANKSSDLTTSNVAPDKIPPIDESKMDKNKKTTWTGNWGSDIVAKFTTDQCSDSEFINQGYTNLASSSIPETRLKKPSDAYFISGGRATTVLGCWFKKDGGLVHVKFKRKHDGKVWEQDQNFDDAGIWTKNVEENENILPKDALEVANEQINIVWNGASKDIRSELLPEQKAWLKQREDDCSLKANSTETGDATKQDAIRDGCMAEMTNQRTEILRQKILALRDSKT